MNLNFFTYPKGISINVQFNKHKGENPGNKVGKRPDFSDRYFNGNS